MAQREIDEREKRKGCSGYNRFFLKMGSDEWNFTLETIRG